MEAISKADAVLGANIRKARMARGVTMKAMGASLEEPISYQQVQKYEQGYNRVTALVLAQFARILDVSVGTLLEGIDIEQDYAARLPLDSLSDQNLIRSYAKIENKAIKDAVRIFVAAISTELNRNFTKAKPGGSHGA